MFSETLLFPGFSHSIHGAVKTERLASWQHRHILGMWQQLTFDLCLSLSILCALLDLSFATSYFSDSVVLKLKWPGDAAVPDDLLLRYQKQSIQPDDESAVLLSTVDNEKYLCSIPRPVSAFDEEQKLADYTGPSPKELLAELHKQRSCTYRIEMYWTYELCHGRYLRQFHEEKEISQKISLQEYYLGQFMPGKSDKDEQTFDIARPPRRKVEDKFLPSFPVKYIQGTYCDISKMPRVANVYYVCIEDARNQIYALDEVSSCEYDVVILTPSLCSHPSFRPKRTSENVVSCYPMNHAPPKPTALTIWEQEQKWDLNMHTRNLILGPGGDPFPSRAESSGSAARPHVVIAGSSEDQGDLDADDDETQSELQEPRPEPVASDRTYRASPEPPPPLPTDEALLRSFLSGHYCLYGGSGWWKHELCHTKQVIQFHEDQATGQRIDILLGKWVESDHLEWLQQRPHKRPKKDAPGRILQVSHFYSHGDFCDVSGAPRNVEVRLRCRETPGNPNAVTLYLLEPKSCEYMLGVESQMFCDVLQTTDENGIFAKK